MRFIVPLCLAILAMALAAARRSRRAREEAAAAPGIRYGIIHRSGRHLPFGCGPPDDPHVDQRCAIIRRRGRPDEIRAIQPSESRRRTCHECYLETGRQEPEKASSS